VNADQHPEPQEVSAEEVQKHLETLFKSPCFAPSRRCQEFLQYVVLEVIEGRADLIKERNIAHEVFGKGTDFESSEDSLVRVKAREVRKRLSDYYQSAPDSGLRIEIPLGGYVPVVHRSQELAALDGLPEAVENDAPKPMNRRRFAWILGGTLGALGIASASVSLLFRQRSAPLDLLWRPVFASKEPLLIFIPIMHLRDGSTTEWVGLGPAATLDSAATFLTKHNYPYHLRFGADLTFSQMREQPSLLLGGFFSKWTQMLTHGLRFAPSSNDDTAEPAIIDRQTQQTWKPVRYPPNPYVDADYGILSRLFDSESRQISILAVGTRTFGTEGAASILFDPQTFSDLLKHAPRDWETKSFQALIRVSVIGTTLSPPEILATHFW
jgi:hypothetical protein